MLGTVVNLFVKIPSDHPGANPPKYFGGLVTSVSWLGTLVQAMRLRGGRRITMAVGFALAMAAYGALLYRTGIATPMPEL